MKEIASSAPGAIKQFGRNFIFAAFLPGAILVLVNVYLLLPIWSGRSDLFLGEIKLELPLVGFTGLAALVALLFISLLVAIIFAGLNSTFICLLEGKYWWQRSVVLLPLLYAKQVAWKKEYGSLEALRKRYRHITETWFRKKNGPDRLVLEETLIQLRKDIDETHIEVEKKYRRQSLPHSSDLLAPTAFGNAYAIVEEYAYERYGIDAVLFWPRLQLLIEKRDTSISERLSYATGSLDLAINLAFVSFIVLLELAATLWSLPASRSTPMFVGMGMVLLLCLAFYRASVNAVHSLGEVITSSFDFHRDLLLDAYGLRKPASLDEEQRLWVKLATFVRRGDDFYFPAEFAVASQEPDGAVDA